jgi:hypothetical protein
VAGIVGVEPAGGVDEQPGEGGGVEGATGPVKPFGPGVDDLGTEALGGATESPPIELVLLAALVGDGVLKPDVALVPQAAMKTASTTAPAAARIAGARLSRRRSPAPQIPLCTDPIDLHHLTQEFAEIDFWSLKYRRPGLGSLIHPKVMTYGQVPGHTVYLPRRGRQFPGRRNRSSLRPVYGLWLVESLR